MEISKKQAEIAYVRECCVRISKLDQLAQVLEQLLAALCVLGYCVYARFQVFGNSVTPRLILNTIFLYGRSGRTALALSISFARIAANLWSPFPAGTCSVSPFSDSLMAQSVVWVADKLFDPLMRTTANEAYHQLGASYRDILSLIDEVEKYET